MTTSMIPKNNIFGLFNNEEENSIEVHEDFMDNPYIKIGMFNKIIINNSIFVLRFKKFLDTIDPNQKIKDYENFSPKFITFNRAFFYIKDIDIENQHHADAIRCYDFDNLLKNLTSSISFFEESEEYEKCAHLYKIKKFIEGLLETT